MRTCHDVSDGGLLVAVAEMAMAGGVGASIETGSARPHPEPLHAWLFGEDQGRYVIAVSTKPLPSSGGQAPSSLRRESASPVASS